MEVSYAINSDIVSDIPLSQSELIAAPAKSIWNVIDLGEAAVFDIEFFSFEYCMGLNEVKAKDIERGIDNGFVDISSHNKGIISDTSKHAPHFLIRRLFYNTVAVTSRYERIAFSMQRLA